MNLTALKLALKPDEGQDPSWPKVRSIVQSNIKPIYWALLDAAKKKDMASMIANLKKLTKELDVLSKYLDLNSLKRKYKQVENIDLFRSE